MPIQTAMSAAMESPVKLVIRPYPVGRETGSFQRTHDAKHLALRVAQGAFAFEQPLCEGRKLPCMRRACVSGMNPDEEFMEYGHPLENGGDIRAAIH